MKKILITGGSGNLGQYLNLKLSENFEILTCYKNNIGNCSQFKNMKIDLTDLKSIENIITSFQPNIIIHTAAISSPIISKDITAKAIYKSNVIATEQLAKICKVYGIKLIYTSTDLVYAGYRGSMLKEDSKIAPISIYAETKLMGEIKIQKYCENYIIMRTALMYGFGLNHSYNFFNQIYFNLKNGIELQLFYDQIRTPLSLFDAARIINDLCKLDIKNEIINFGGKDRISRLELGEIICRITGFDNKLIKKISMNDITNYPAVEDVSMDTEKLQSYGINQQTVEESMNEIFSKIPFAK